MAKVFSFISHITRGLGKEARVPSLNGFITVLLPPDRYWAFFFLQAID